MKIIMQFEELFNFGSLFHTLFHLGNKRYFFNYVSITTVSKTRIGLWYFCRKDGFAFILQKIQDFQDFCYNFLRLFRFI